MLSSSSFFKLRAQAHHLEKKSHVVVYGAQGLQLADFMPQQGYCTGWSSGNQAESFVARAAPRSFPRRLSAWLRPRGHAGRKRMSNRPLSRAGSIKAVEILGVGIDHGNNLAQNLFRKAHLHPADNAL